MTKEEILDETMRCTIDDDTDLDNPENFYFRYNDVLTAMETYAKQPAKNCSIPAVMPRFTYRLFERGQVRTFEIGQLNNPRTSPKEWCDRRLCEGFWGDEESCKKVVSLLNGA